MNNLGRLAAIGSLFSSFQASHEYREAQQRALDHLAAARQYQLGILNSRPGGIIRCDPSEVAFIAAPAKPSKCPSCGSHEWRQHNNVRVCAYCRCGA